MNEQALPQQIQREMWDPKKWAEDGTFHIGINMAGAVSAGAYTAGVLDFLTEALEQWYTAKAAEDPRVPMHDVCIDVFSGASAGGMCAAIASVMLQGEFDHIKNTSLQDTNNKFYESWVNRIDIEWLLQDKDLQGGQEVISLLDSTIIDEIAAYALAPGGSTKRPYVSDSLTLFLTLTNVRGTSYAVTGDADGSAEEDTAYYGDKLQFETVKAGNKPLSPYAKPLRLGVNGDDWTLLQQAAKSTGAFPLFLAPRRIERPASDYLFSPWEPVSRINPTYVPPNWTLQPDDTFETLNVDGGVTDNDPFQLAHDFLAVHNPKAFKDKVTGELSNPPKSEDANAAVLTVAPFPSDEVYIPEDKYDFAGNMSIFGMLPNLFTVLISQSRFLGESLSKVMFGNSCSRFVLAPTDDGVANTEALQCGLLDAFGGFFERGFRAHDYQLGRRNCQKFLKDYFRLSKDNQIIKDGLSKLDEQTRNEVIGEFASDVKGQENTVPIIPLCGTAKAVVPQPQRAKISQDRLDQVLGWIVKRMRAVSGPLIENLKIPGAEKVALHGAADILISTLAKTKLRDALQSELEDVIAP